MDLDFTKFQYDLGKQKGNREAGVILNPRQEKTDMLDPLLAQLESSIRLSKAHPDALADFEGFVFGYAAAFVKENLASTEKKHLIASPELEKQLGLQNLDQLNEQQKESRKKLIVLLTATLTEAKLLTSN